MIKNTYYHSKDRLVLQMQRDTIHRVNASDSAPDIGIGSLTLGERQATRMGDGTGFRAIPDRFKSLQDVRKEIKSIVDVDIGLIFGIDYTMSNSIQGKKTFGGKSLHTITNDCVNPYQEVICIIGETLGYMDSDGIIPAYGFGDAKFKDKGIFPLKDKGQCKGFSEVFSAYNKKTKEISFGDPTNFAPLIREAISIVKTTKQLHILIIAADGQVNEEEDTVAAIVEASNYPLSIVVIGVGDGPWHKMIEFDDKLPKRRFDNFQFVNFHEIQASAKSPEPAIALAALMEVPDQFKAIKRLGLYNNC